MRKYLLLFSLLFLIPNLTQAKSNQTLEQKTALEIQELILQRRYSSAIKMLESLELKPYSPLPTLVRMTIVQLKMAESFKYNRVTEFKNYSEVNESICEHVEDQEKLVVWDMMLCGASDSIRAFYYVKKNQTFKAVAAAKSSIRRFHKVKALDPNNIDIELGQALYDFFKSQLTETKLKFIPFLKDRREESLVVIRKVSQQGVYAKNLADFALALIAMETASAPLGHQVFARLEYRFPQNFLFKILHAVFLINIKDYKSALNMLSKLEQQNGQESIVKYFMARALVMQGEDLAKAEQYIHNFQKSKPDKDLQGASYYLLGVIFEKRGHTEKALELYEQAHELFPRYKQSLKAIRRLQKS